MTDAITDLSHAHELATAEVCGVARAIVDLRASGAGTVQTPGGACVLEVAMERLAEAVARERRLTSALLAAMRGSQ